jgi:hypothetical protein
MFLGELERQTTPAARAQKAFSHSPTGQVAMSASQLEMPCTPMNGQISPSHVLKNVYPTVFM